jgi:carboxymethylenebutenolidase
MRILRMRCGWGALLGAALLVVAAVCLAGCAGSPDAVPATPAPTNEPSTTLPTPTMPLKTGLQTRSEEVTIESGNRTYPAFLAEPTVLHSVNGMEPGYRELTTLLAAEGFVVIAPEWQTYEQFPDDEVIEALISDSILYLQGRPEVDAGKIGLTGFSAGGRYVMLFLARIQALKAGVAWYGFPYSGGIHNQFAPADLVQSIEDPLLIIHGTRDEVSAVSGIYRYATALDEADKYFELKVYQGQPHEFMIENGTLSKGFVALDAFHEMVSFFERTLV